MPDALIVDDHEPTATALAALARTEGFTVSVSSSLDAARAHLARHPVNVILLDLKLPDGEGLSLVDALDPVNAPAVVLITGEASLESAVNALRRGVTDYLTKPVDDSELMARLNTGRRILELERSLKAANHEKHLLSITDPLTATFNRCYLMEQLQNEIERARRYSRPLTAVLCDIDHFKKVNDTHGHQAGDDVLRGFAQLLLNSSRKGLDWVARYGGEEFLIVLPETRVEDGVGFAEKIRSLL